jgi:23S rRNA pseudouridine1911/1915/1917 synthase
MKRIVLIVNAEQAGRRLDQFLTAVHPELSRGEVQRDIRAGTVSISGQAVCQPSRRLHENDEVVWDLVDKKILTPHPMALDILHEDDHLVVVDKPTGLVVHPGAGTDAPTLVEGLLFDRALPPSDDPVRPGVVHRLDKETSGVIVVAKTSTALAQLQRQFADHSVTKSYIAVVGGILREEEGTIDAPVGRDPAHPRRMSIQSDGRAAQTDFRVLRRLEDSTLLHAQPRTGRTHQLRVHFRYIGHPVLGDAIYGSASAQRLLLHAWRITVRHPATDEVLRFEAPIPPGFPCYPFDELPWSDRPDPI